MHPHSVRAHREKSAYLQDDFAGIPGIRQNLVGFFDFGERHDRMDDGLDAAIFNHGPDVAFQFGQDLCLHFVGTAAQRATDDAVGAFHDIAHGQVGESRRRPATRRLPRRISICCRGRFR